MKNTSFAMKAQMILLVLLVLCFIMLTQQIFKPIYTIGGVLLTFFAMIQMAVGNIDLSYNFKLWINALVKIMLIIIAVFGISMVLAPLFLNKTFVTAFLIALIVGTVVIFGFFIIRGAGTENKSMGDVTSGDNY